MLLYKITQNTTKKYLKTTYLNINYKFISQYNIVYFYFRIRKSKKLTYILFIYYDTKYYNNKISVYHYT